MENSERKAFEKVLRCNGFTRYRQTGSHIIYKNAAGLVASVPLVLHKYTANKIAKDCNINWHK